MIREIQAKTLLQRVKQPDPWFGLRYNFNLYRGCQHQCIYCDSRSACYGIDNFSDILVKENAVELLGHELSRLRIKGTIGTGSMNDPYMPLEKQYRLTRKALELIAEHRFGVHIITKSDLVVRDIDLLQRIARFYATVSFTITTADDALGKVLEPGATLISDRFRAMRELSRAGIQTGVTLMPVLPFIEDNEENLVHIMQLAAENGARYIVSSLGMTLRDQQRDYYYQELDKYFPGLRPLYEQRYGGHYGCNVPNQRQLERVLRQACEQYGIHTGIIPWQPPRAEQLELF